MEALVLQGRSILVVEDEHLIALNIVDCFRQAGASVLSAHNLRDGLRLAGYPDLSAAVVDFGLRDGDGTTLCERLAARNIPFVIHSGHSHVQDVCHAGCAVVPKPAHPQVLVSAVAGLLP